MTQETPLTKDDLGNMLHKYLTPVYEKMQGLHQEMGAFKKSMIQEMDLLKGIQLRMEKRMGTFEGIQLRMEKRMGTFEGIQLRMENKLDDQVRALFDRGDMHDQKLSNHEKRIINLEQKRIL